MIVLYSKPPLWCIGELQCIPGDLNLERTLCTTVKKTYGVLLRRAFKVNAVLKPPVTQSSPQKNPLKVRDWKKQLQKESACNTQFGQQGRPLRELWRHWHAEGGEGKRCREKVDVSVWPQHGRFFRDYIFNLGVRKRLREEKRKNNNSERGPRQRLSGGRASRLMLRHTPRARELIERESKREGDKDGGAA